VTQPKTLFEMAGVNTSLPPLDSVSVVLIDMQMEYLDGLLPLPGAKAALAEAASLLRLARDAGRPVIHIQHQGRAGGIFDPAGAGFRLADPVTPQGPETVLTKGLPNAFTGTELDAVLKSSGAKQIVVGGFMTHMCVSSTVRAALDRGYGAVVVASACGTRDLPDGRGGVVSAETLHTVELAALADRFALIAPNAAALSPKPR